MGLGLKQKTQIEDVTWSRISWLKPNFRYKIEPYGLVLALYPTPIISKKNNNLASINLT
jgi:hypothetical protein